MENVVVVFRAKKIDNFRKKNPKNERILTFIATPYLLKINIAYQTADFLKTIKNNGLQWLSMIV